MPICTRCQRDKPEDQFSFRNRATKKRVSHCKECVKTYQRRHYRNDPGQYMQRNQKVFEKKRAYLDQEKNRPCADCGREFPSYAMDFHHREGAQKDSNLADLIKRNVSWKRLREEVAKCDVVCAVCHRIRHHNDS